MIIQMIGLHVLYSITVIEIFDGNVAVIDVVYPIYTRVYKSRHYGIRFFEYS